MMAELPAERRTQTLARRSFGLSAAQAGVGRAAAEDLDAAIRRNLEVLGYGE